MIRTTILSALLFLGANAFAATSYEVQVNAVAQSLAIPVEAKDVIDWKVGDSSTFKMSSSIINGSIVSFVREAVTEGYWVQQDMDLGMMGKQKVEILYDKSNGQVLQLLVNGKKETPPSPSDMEVIETKNETITVPKGTFDCFYAKVNNKKDNQISEVWLNPDLIPVGGMAKTLANSQFGVITIELTDFIKN